jgi:putative sigma-54 modulation protein
MDVLLKVRHGALPDAVRSYAETRIGKLGHYLPSLAEATVELSEEKTRKAADRWVVQVTTNAHGRLLRAEERGPDARQAIDAAHDAMVRQIVRLKGRVYRSNRPPETVRTPAPLPDAEALPDEEDDAFDGKVVRTKTFSLKPMTPEEAAEQMELLGHEFFLFVDAGNERCSVIYKRRDGQYGLLVPEH